MATLPNKNALSISTGRQTETLKACDVSSNHLENMPTSTEELTLKESLTLLESLPDEEQRTEYFKTTVLPLLAEAETIEKAQAVKKAGKFLGVSMQDVTAAIKEFTGNTNNRNPNQADSLTKLALSNILFHDDLGESYTLIKFEDCNRVMKVGQSKNFICYLTGEYYKQTGTSPGNEAIRQAVTVAESQAMFEGKEYKLELRIAKHDGAFWYDLADEKNRAVKITPNGWQIVDRPPILFRRRKIQKEQSEPLEGKGDIWQLSKFINLDEDSLKLLIIYLVACLIPEIPHPMPIFHGEKGAAKSTSMQFIKRLIDPATRELFALPKGQNELAQQLYGNYMPCYDNLSGLSQMQSDLLCGAATGGGISKRTLYSNDEDTILKFFCCPVLNGINVVANATDLLDRCIIFELKRIPEEERQEITKVSAYFENARQAIFTGLLDTLSKAMKLYPTVKLNRLPRMADFTVWGYAIAEALGIGGETFIDLYRQNRAKVNSAAIDENLLATAILELMSNNDKINCSATELFDKLNIVAEEIKIDTRSKYWPKDPGALSKRIMHIKSNLLDVGIKYDTYRLGGNKGRGRRVTLERLPNLPSPASLRP